MQDARNLVDARRVGARDHGLLVDVTHEGNFPFQSDGHLTLSATDDGIGLNADLPQRGDGMLRGFGLHLPRRLDVGHERDVQEERVGAADALTHLAGRFEEWQRFDIPDGATQLVDDDIDVASVHREHPRADLVGDMWDDLYGVAEVVATTLFRDDGGIDLAGGDIRVGGEVDVEETLVVADVEVGLCAVLGDEHLAVLEGVHGAGVHVEVRIQLLHGHAEPTCDEEIAEAGGREALTEGGDDASRNKDVFGSIHGPPA